MHRTREEEGNKSLLLKDAEVKKGGEAPPFSHKVDLRRESDGRTHVGLASKSR